MINHDAVKFAEKMIGDGHYRINSQWREAQPSAAASERFYSNAQSPDDFSRWFLTVDAEANGDGVARYQLPIGDFKNVHRSGLIAAKSEAVKRGDAELEAQITELLDFLDRISAC